MESQSEFQLSSSQYALLRQRLRNLYDHIRQHPALQQRYLWVGKGKPDIDPDIGTQIVAERQVSKKKMLERCLIKFVAIIFELAFRTVPKIK